MNQNSLYRFRATSYAMGAAVASVEFVDTTRKAPLNRAIRRLPARGLPGSHPRAAAISQVVGVKRLEPVGG